MSREEKGCRSQLPVRCSWEMLCVLFLLLAEVVLAGGREEFNLNPGWKFLKADVAGAQAPGFDDSGWAGVSVPHTYNDVDTFDDLSPGRMLGETNQWSGRTWYRKTFTLPEGYRGRRVYVEFEGVRQVAAVYLNGH